MLDPKQSWAERLVWHEYNECRLYHSFMETEVDLRIKAIWELHLAMELEHLRLACELYKTMEKKDAAEILPRTVPPIVTFEPNIAYVRDVLAAQVDLTADGEDFVPVADLPAEHRYFQYQAKVNEAGSPSDHVIAARRAAAQGLDYRAVHQRLTPHDVRVEDAHVRVEAETDAKRPLLATTSAL